MRAAPARTVHEAANPDLVVEHFAEDVRHYLTRQPRQLPSRYFYDALGSALFDAICELPWYPITRAETRLLREHAASILAGADAPDHIVELGAGNGAKLATLIENGLPGGRRVTIHLVDVSPAALAAAAGALAGRPGVQVVTHEAPYEDGLERIRRGSGPGRALVLFLGSNIGNFDRSGTSPFLDRVRRALAPGDRLLLGADLVKPEADLRLAYDDPLQVTAAFNRNLLVRINRELEGDFDLDQFRHLALWNEPASRVEMHLVSRRRQRVRIGIANLDLTLSDGERIWTESSYKYTTEEIGGLLWASGFRARHQWVDEPGRFALTLAAI